MNTDNMHRWCDLNVRKKELKAELKEVEAEMTELGPKIIDTMLEEQIPRQAIDGFTLYPRKETYVKIREFITVDGDDMDGLDIIKQRLEDNGYGNIVKPLTQSLKALVKSLTLSEEGEAEKELPEWLSSAIETTTETKLAARKA